AHPLSGSHSLSLSSHSTDLRYPSSPL
ncbi:hypothetical protein SOVF_214870, partial [Spinacia oleracea]